MKYQLSSKIAQRILTDNSFSLELSIYLDKRQDSILRLVKRNSTILRTPEVIEFYLNKGYKREEMFDRIENPEFK